MRILLTNISLALFSALAFGLSSCSSVPTILRVDPALLADLPPEKMASIQLARSEHDVTEDSLANASKQSSIAADAVELARAELDVVAAKVDQGKVKLSTTQRQGTPAETEIAKASYTKLLGSAEVARLGLALSKREREVAKLRESVALEESRLAESRVELSKGVALEGMDMPARDAVPLKDLRAQERFNALEIEIANKRLSAARVEVQKARNAHAAAIDDLQSKP